MDISILRRETAADHQAVEAVMPVMGQNLDVAGYVDCLDRLYGIVAGWERHAIRIAPDWLRDSLALRQRSRMLESDLTYFDHVPSEERCTFQLLEDLPQLLGAMYVMEGSTLGGQLIARHLEKHLDLKTGLGNAYFVGHGEQTGRMWKDLCQMLETQILERDAKFVILGAKQMFSTFGTWMQRNLAPVGR